MTSHPPSGPPSVPPAGPPSGPLSGRSTRPGSAGPPPPAGPPHDGSGGGSGGGGSSGGSGSGGSGASRSGGPGKGPWWRSVPKVASVTAVVVAAAALVVVLTNRPDGDGTAGAGGGEVFLQNAAAAGPDPFTKSTARTGGASASPASLPPRTASATTEVSGSTPGLYGGTRSVASCDVEQQVRYLSGEPAKNTAFASVLGISANEVPAYLRSLTPLQLRADTRVTNHGFRDGAATTYQAVLQAGTAVLVDNRGAPRVRCACGNPLTDPVAQKEPRTTGTPWQGYSTSQVVVVAPSVTVVNVFVVYDPEDEKWFARKHGDTGRQDKPTPPPPRPPFVSPTASAPTSPSTSTSTSPSSPTDSPSTDTSSPPTSPSDTSPSTDTSSPESSPPTESSPSTESSEPGSSPATEGPADLTTTSEEADRSASVGSPASVSPLSPPADTATASVSGPASLPVPGPQAAAGAA
ncbi:DUF6777 domain-containing protein [Streptomyces sp. NPDC002773]|uniref:DUF6777 domain-containing protein n=1 Tax=Streptomyces sp. NPDC002773 TaxID=3154430 RepID=UPI00332EE25B